MAGRMPAVSLPVGIGSRVVFHSYRHRTPVLSIGAGTVLVSLTLPERLDAGHVAFARQLADRARAYAIEVERAWRNGTPAPTTDATTKEVS